MWSGWLIMERRVTRKKLIELYSEVGYWCGMLRARIWRSDIYAPELQIEALDGLEKAFSDLRKATIEILFERISE